MVHANLGSRINVNKMKSGEMVLWSSIAGLESQIVPRISLSSGKFGFKSQDVQFDCRSDLIKPTARVTELEDG